MIPKRFIPEWTRRVRRSLKRAPPPVYALSYESIITLQRFLLSKTWVQKIFYPRRVRLVRAWADLCSHPDPSAAILGSLMSNTWIGWRTKALQQPGVLARRLTVEGMEKFQQALARERGIIIVNLHAIRSGLIPHVVQSVCRKQVHQFAGRVSETDQGLVMATYVRRVIETQTLLQQGEIVVISGDGLRGATNIALPFYGRLFPFRSGFADLAIRTDASVLPIFTYYALDGGVTLEFGEAIQPGPGTREAQVDEMVRQYARLLEERWPRLLPSMTWYKLKQTLAMPPASD